MRKKIGFIKLIQLWGIIFLTALAGVIVAIDLVTTYHDQNIRVDNMRKDYVEKQKQKAKREVERVVNMMNYERRQNEALIGTELYVNVEQLQATWMERINNIRFGKKWVGYLFVDDWNGKSLAHGAQPDLINTEMWEYEDSRGNKTTQLLVAASKKKDGGFASFWWRKPDTGEERPKIVYAKGIPEWELFVGSGVYIDDIEQNIAILQEVLDKQTKTKIFISLIIVVIAFALFLVVFNLLSNRLKKDLNLFISFFDQAAFSDKKIDRETVQFIEFDQMAENANKMLQDKMKVEIEREQAVERLKERGELLSDILNNPLIGMYRIEVQSKKKWTKEKSPFSFIYINERFCEMSGISREKNMSDPTIIFSLIHPDDLENYTRLNEEANKNMTKFSWEGRVIINGQTKWWNFESIPRSKDKTNTVWTGTLMDITERKKAEEELASSAERLEQRVEERTKDLESFAYSISHDLRAPLRHMSGFTKMFMDHAGEGLDDKGRRYLDVVTSSAELMGVLIDDLLQFSRTGRAELRMSQVDMGPLVKEAIDQLQPEIEGRNIEWKIGALPEVRADRAMMLLVLVNLISNAIKFTSPREKALIEISTGGDDEDETVFFVRDNGVGFDMKYVNKLFGVFQRLHRKEDFEGTGIGLANVRRIISRHGGRSWAEADVDKGATIWFSLPK